MFDGDRDRYCIVASDQAHFSLEKDAVINGLSRACIVRVKTDSRGRIRPGEVWKTAEGAKRDGRIPILFVCTAGTTNAGILEPADEFMDAARLFQSWCHIDAAHAQVFWRHFGKKSLNEIDHQMIEEFKIKRVASITRYGRTRKPASVNRELAILSGIFRMAVDYEEITDNPCRKLESLPKTISERDICLSRRKIDCFLR